MARRTRSWSLGLAPWAKAGIILEPDTNQGTCYTAVMVTGTHGVQMQYNYTHDSPGLSGAVGSSSPRWLRLTRQGDVVTGYDSADGVHWNEIVLSASQAFPAQPRSACSHLPGVLHLRDRVKGPQASPQPPSTTSPSRASFPAAPGPRARSPRLQPFHLAAAIRRRVHHQRVRRHRTAGGR